MGSFRFVFLLIYFLFHAILLFASFQTISKIKASDFKFINGFINDENLFLNSSNLITFTVFGLALFGINVLILWLENSAKKKTIDKKDREIMALKAKLFDLGEGVAPTQIPEIKTQETEDGTEEK